MNSWKNKAKYVVMQGILSSSGIGDMHLIKSFTNKKEAVKFFNSIKKDISVYKMRYNRYAKDYLATSVEKIVDMEENEYVEYFECDAFGNKRRY